MSSFASAAARPARWNAEQIASIDWENVEEILLSGYTFLEMVSLHPALAAKYKVVASSSSPQPGGMSNEERRRRRQYLIELFRNPMNAVGEGDGEEAAAATTGTTRTATAATAGGGEAHGVTQSNDNTNGVGAMWGDIFSRQEAVRQLIVSEKRNILCQWIAQGLFQRRITRWCRCCGAKGHSIFTCPTTAGKKLRNRAAVTTPPPPTTTTNNNNSNDNNEEEEEGNAVLAGRKRARAEDPTSAPTVLGKFYMHQQKLEKNRLIQEKVTKNSKAQGSRHGNNNNNNNNNNNGQQRQTQQKELDLFSDERRRGVVERLEVAYNMGFVRTAGAADYKFFLDRSDVGVKRLQVGDRVTFKADTSREYPMAVDVRAEFPVITGDDVARFMAQCRLAGANTTAMDLLAMLVSHVSEWHDVLRILMTMCTKWLQSCESGDNNNNNNSGADQMVQRLLEEEPGTFSSSLLATLLPKWVGYVQSIVELTTFHTNREPVHTPILAAFIKLLVTPVPQAKPPPPNGNSGGGGGATTAVSNTNTTPTTNTPTTNIASPTTAGSPSSLAGSPTSATYPSSPSTPSPGPVAPFRFFPDVISKALGFWENTIISSHLRECVRLATTTTNTTTSAATAARSKNISSFVSFVVDSMCEASDFIVLLHQYTASDTNVTLSLKKVREVLLGMMNAMLSILVVEPSSSRPHASALFTAQVRHVHAAKIRLERVSVAAGAVLPLLPSEEELEVPPPHKQSVFHPSRLPVQRIATLVQSSGKTNNNNTDNNAEGEEDNRNEEGMESRTPGVSSSAGSVVPSPYTSREPFILSHCQLLRADTFESTARILAASCFSLKKYPPDASTVSDVEHAALYDHVTFVGRVVPRDRDYAHPVGYLFQVKPKSAHANLYNKLQQGTCVCFVTALDESRIALPSSPSSTAKEAAPPEIFWGVISSCDVVLQRAGIVVVSPCTTNHSHSPPPFSQLLNNLTRNAKQGRLDRCLLLETPIFYAGYAAIMNSLANFLGPLAMPLPLGKRLIGPSDAELQQRRREEETKEAVRVVVKMENMKVSEDVNHNNNEVVVTSSSRKRAVLWSGSRPLLPYIPAHCGQAFCEIIQHIRQSNQLDEGQEKVMANLPYQDILLVQGPPGTGKSFIGCRVVEAYVRFKQQIRSGQILQHVSVSQLGDVSAGWSHATLLPSLGPIVVITFKNHALDEFLIDLLNSSLWQSGSRSTAAAGSIKADNFYPGGQRLVRIGGRSKETGLDAFNLSSLMRENADKSVITRYREHIWILHQRLDRLIKEIRHLENGRVPKTYFEKWLTPEQRRHIDFEDRDEWLQGGRYTTKDGKQAPPMDKHYYKTLLKTAMDTAINESEEAAATTTSGQASSSSSPPLKRSRTEKEKAGEEEEVEVEAAAAEEEDGEGAAASTGGDDDISRSIFQQMRREDETREYNNNLHTTALSAEAIYLANHRPTTPEGVPASLQSLWSLEPETRHRYYAFLIQKAIAEKAINCFHIIARIQNFLVIRNHAMENAKLSLLKGADVVGLTTTGCAMNQNIIRSLRPSVLVVEEAAEVLESQLLAGMTDSLQQVILIGDHFQLQPKVETFAYEKTNHMNLSLFERLSGHVEVIRLTEQRRMHPDISSLVRTFYPHQSLIDHPLLLTRGFITATGFKSMDGVPGLARRVFFWRHDCPEETAPGGSRSKINRQELEMVRQCVAHVVRCGAMQRSITVITPYLGQSRMLRSHLRLSSFPDVQVSTVDLFQGDENDIVILSLVRTARLTDFLKTRNRLVVSCSRARFAMVIIGSDTLLRECDHWKMLLDMLEERQCVGDKLPIHIMHAPVTGGAAGVAEEEVGYLVPRKPQEK